MAHLKAIGLFVVFAVLVAPLSVWAQDHMEVSPLEYHFGDVLVGEAASVVVTITNVNGADVILSTIRLENVSTPSFFSITSIVPPPPIIIDIGASYDVTVVFAPTGGGMHSCTLHILSNALDGDVSVPLEGVGISGACR